MDGFGRIPFLKDSTLKTSPLPKQSIVSGIQFVLAEVVNIQALKKLITLAILAIVCFTASAEFRWGVQAGVNVSNYYWKQPLLKSSYGVGPTAGLIGEIMIPGIGFGIDFGLRYNMRASSVNLGDHYVWSSDGYGDVNYKLHQLQLPVNLRFKYTNLNGFEQYAAPFVFAGPVFNFALKQSNCPAIEHPAASVGLQFGLGGEFLEKIQLSFAYRLGVAYEIRTVKLDNLSARSSGFNINVAYLF